jgi:hypothetical protein
MTVAAASLREIKTKQHRCTCKVNIYVQHILKISREIIFGKRLNIVNYAAAVFMCNYVCINRVTTV